jgi:phenylacetate-CoA ligase
VGQEIVSVDPRPGSARAAGAGGSALKRFARAAGSRALLASIYGSALLAQAVLRPLGNISSRLRGKPAGAGGTDHTVLVLATFYTKNWCLAHLTPLALAANVRQVIAVVDGPTQPIEKVTYSYPPRWWARLLGRALAKFLWALRLAVRHSPDVVMGYHLVPAAVSALLVARAAGARAAYQVTGGPVEIEGGGAGSENYVLKSLQSPSPLIERLACAVARRFDLIVVRGPTARDFMTRRGLGRHVEIVPGSIDRQRFSGGAQERIYDIVTVSRLVPFKQPEHLLEILLLLRERRPDFRAIVLGDGPLLEPLKARAAALGLGERVVFKGYVEDVESYLRQSKVFILTSKWEGLSIAMAEAMAAGAVPVVADVGDLGELVRDGETGFRVTPGGFEEYAARIQRLLEEPAEFRRFSEAARAAALAHNAADSVAARWALLVDKVLNEAGSAPRAGRPAPRRRPLWRCSRLRFWRAVPWPVKRLLAPVARLIPPGLVLGSQFRKVTAFLKQAERWPPDANRDYQLAQLRRVLTLAFERTQYYREAFRSCGFDPRELKSIDGLSALPTIDRSTVNEHLREMCTRPPESAGVDSVSTGGTSGVPLRFFIDTSRSAVEYAYLIASWKRAGYQIENTQAVLRGNVVPPDRHGLRHQYDPLLRRHYYSTFHLTDENLRRYVEHLAGLGPCYLHGYPSSVSALARFLERSGLPAPANIRGVLVGSENVYPEDRRRAERVLGVRYFSWYGHSEKLVMAAECEHSSDYHVWPSYGFFELLDAQGRPVTTPGQRGEIVGTGFINTVVPFIRYRTGDHATYVGARCEACGRAHPVIREIRGHRTQEALVALDRSLISWTSINMHDDTFDCVRQFQFTQTVPGRATLKIVPAGGFGPAGLERIGRNLNRKLSGRLEFDIAIVDSIPLTKSGKSTFVDQHIPLDDLDADSALLSRSAEPGGGRSVEAR